MMLPDPILSDVAVAARRVPDPAAGKASHVELAWQHGAWLVARREMRDLLSDWRILGPSALLILVLPVLLVIMSWQGHAFLERRSPDFRFDDLIPFATMVVGFFPVSFSLMMGLESFAGEKERNTLEALLSTPLSDRALYLGKLFAALIPPLVGSYVAMTLYLLGTVALVGYRPAVSILAALILLNFGQALMMIGSALIVSSHTTSVRAANLLAAFIILPMSVLIQASNAIMIWGAGDLLWLIGLALCLFAALLIRMGLRLFNREQILAREMDDFHPSRLAATFARLWRLPPGTVPQFRGGPGLDAALPPMTLQRLYRGDIPTLLAMRWPEIGIVVVTLGMAVLLGWAYAGAHPLLNTGLLGGIAPSALADNRLQAPTGGQDPITWLLLLVLGGAVRVALLGVLLAVLGVISFGILPLLIVMGAAGGVGFVVGQLAIAGLPIFPPSAWLLLPSVLAPAVALVLLTAFAARFGLAVAAPPKGFSLGDSLLLAMVEYLKIGAVLLPLLVLGEVLQVILALIARAVR